MSQKRITLVEIAKEAGVSAQTVSRVVNGHHNVAEGTRYHVQSIIDRVGYHPSRLARSLLRGRSNTIGVVTYGLGLYGPSQTLGGIVHEAKRQGFSIFPTVLNSPEAELPQDIIGRLIEHHVDGIIWAVPQIGNNRTWVAEAIGRQEVPMVFITMESQPGLAVATVDNRLGGFIATEHLIAQGNRTIGLIKGQPDWWETQQRERGWREALQAHDLPIHEDLHVSGDWSAASGEQSMRLLLQRHPKIDAVFVCNDSMAMGALKAAREADRKVPENLSIIGFDDIPEAAYVHPPLSTVRQDLAALGNRAVTLLSELIGSPGANGAPEPILIEPVLVARDST